MAKISFWDAEWKLDWISFCCGMKKNPIKQLNLDSPFQSFQIESWSLILLFKMNLAIVKDGVSSWLEKIWKLKQRIYEPKMHSIPIFAQSLVHLFPRIWIEVQSVFKKHLDPGKNFERLIIFFCSSQILDDMLSSVSQVAKRW